MLAYHLAHMLAQMGFGVLAVDLDPQPDLTAGFLDTERIEALWSTPGGTVWDGVRHTGKADGAEPVSPVHAHDKLALLPGDPALGEFEDIVSLQGTPFHDIITAAGRTISADIALIDLAPGVGPINRSALAAADKVMLALTIDAFSLHGLSSFGLRLRALDERQSPAEQIGYVITTQGSVESVRARAVRRGPVLRDRATPRLPEPGATRAQRPQADVRPVSR